MKHYYYFVTFIYNEDDQVKYGSLELENTSKIAYYEQLKKVAELIKQKHNLENHPIIWSYKLLRTEVVE